MSTTKERESRARKEALEKAKEEEESIRTECESWRTVRVRENWTVPGLGDSPEMNPEREEKRKRGEARKKERENVVRRQEERRNGERWRTKARKKLVREWTETGWLAREGEQREEVREFWRGIREREKGRQEEREVEMERERLARTRMWNRLGMEAFGRWRQFCHWK
jgi:hypothetical protein